MTKTDNYEYDSSDNDFDYNSCNNDDIDNN